MLTVKIVVATDQQLIDVNSNLFGILPWWYEYDYAIRSSKRSIWLHKYGTISQFKLRIYVFRMFQRFNRNPILLYQIQNTSLKLNTHCGESEMQSVFVIFGFVVRSDAFNGSLSEWQPVEPINMNEKNCFFFHFAGYMKHHGPTE